MPGFWVPVLSNILNAKGWGEFKTAAFIIPPIAGILSPLYLAARADQSISAEKLLALLLGGGLIFQWLTFSTLEEGRHPHLFLFYLGLNALLIGPAWSLLTAVCFANLDNPERDFGKYRVWGTLGWMAAGWIISLLGLDNSPRVGDLSLWTRVLAIFCCLMLPPAPPRGAGRKHWWDVLGLGALRILRERDMAVFFATTFLFTIPLSAFYLHAPPHLESLGWKKVGAGMTAGQVAETAAMLLMGYFLCRWRIKWLLSLAIAGGLARYVLFALGDIYSSPGLVLAGVAFHGICWTYFFEAGRVFVERRVEPGLRAQSQSLIGLITGGIGAVAGTQIVGWLHSWLVDEKTGQGWDLYWWSLSGMCAFCLVGFVLAYRGIAPPKPAA